MSPPTRRADHVTDRRFVRTASVALVAVALGLIGCGSSGRTLRDPVPGATAPPRKNTGSTQSSNPGASNGSSPNAVITATGLSLSTTAWTTGQAIPKAYTCDGADTSPSLVITGAPTTAVELVLVVTDQTVTGQSLWMMAGIGPATSSIPQGGVPSGAIQIVNSSGSAQWSGPCPASGTNTYQFGLYALAKPSGLTGSSTKAQVDATIATSIGSSFITGTYSR
jgi:phosphatidylethanolamine-binding protein (PEBP) family uncharacterized protein